MSRKHRISSLLKNEISSILLKKINDTRVGFISLTSVDISPDNKHAWVYYSQIGSDAEKQQTKRGLANATKFIHAELSKSIRYMSIPKLHFRFDDSLERGVDIVQRINTISSEECL